MTSLTHWVKKAYSTLFALVLAAFAMSKISILLQLALSFS